MWLVADIGGTHSRLKVLDATENPSYQVDLLNATFSSFEEVLTTFLTPEILAQIDRACLALAGPVVGGTCQLTALPWWPPIVAQRLRDRWGWKEVVLINDMEAHAWTLTRLPEAQMELLHGENLQSGHRVLLIPGTGLGEAFLYWDGNEFHPTASEGGHCSLAPRTELQISLWDFMHRRYGETSYNTLLGGQGMCLLYDFLVEQGMNKDFQVEEQPIEQRAQDITTRGVHSAQGICAAVVQEYLALLAQEMAYCAFKHSPVGGLFLAGTVLKKLLPFLKKNTFRNEFILHKTHALWLRQIPIYWMNHMNSGIEGASTYIRRYLHGNTSCSPGI